MPINNQTSSFGVRDMEYSVFNTVMGSFVGAVAILALVVKLF